MKLLTLCVVFIAISASPLIAGSPAISIVEKSASGKSKNIVSVLAEDPVARDEIIQLYKEAKKAFPENRRNLFGPDSGYVSIELTDGKDTMVIRSWHPLFVKNRKVVITSRGVESLGGRKLEDVLKEDEEWYREARKVFDKIVSYATSNKEPGEELHRTAPPEPE